MTASKPRLAFFSLVAGLGTLALILFAVGSSQPQAASGAAAASTATIPATVVVHDYVERETNETSEHSLKCTSVEQPLNFESFSLGLEFQGLRLEQVMRHCYSSPAGKSSKPNYVSYLYGSCQPPIGEDGLADGGCPLPLEVQTWPACVRHPSLYDKHDAMGAQPVGIETIRNAQVYFFEEGLRAEIVTGRSTVVIFALDPETVREALVYVDGSPSGSTPRQISLGGKGEPLEPAAAEGKASCKAGEANE